MTSYEYLVSTIRWLIHYSEKNHIPLSEKEKIEAMVYKVMEIAEKLKP